jgi:hypothetical protein
MEGKTEKFTIEITDDGHVVLNGAEGRLEFTAGEALMLLDILRNEEERLKRMAEDASPISISLQKN